MTVSAYTSPGPNVSHRDGFTGTGGVWGFALPRIKEFIIKSASILSRAIPA